MSNVIDQKVVEMRFDNKQFENNVQTSLSTLDRLKKSLNLEGATKGLENVDAASKKLNFSGLSSAVETVQAKFSAFEVMAVTALANITNSAINAGTPNQVNIWDALWLGTDVQILNDSGYPWRRDVKKEENDMEFLEVTSDRCEVFTDTNVNSVDRTFNNGRLVKGEFYPIQSDVGTDGVYHWVRIQAGDKKRYAVVLEDRSKVVSLSAGDAIAACMAQVPHVDTFELEKKLADMTVEKNAVEKRLTDLKAYAAEV